MIKYDKRSDPMSQQKTPQPETQTCPGPEPVNGRTPIPSRPSSVAGSFAWDPMAMGIGPVKHGETRSSAA
jgi:hypothetical protein